MSFNISAWFMCIPELLSLIAAEPLTLCAAAAAAIAAAVSLLSKLFYSRSDTF